MNKVTDRFDLTQDQLSRRVDKVLFLNTCAGYPERYDIYLEGNQIGHFSLRHGAANISCPDVEGATVLRLGLTEEFGKGEFDNEAERSDGLAQATVAVLTWANANPGVYGKGASI